MNKDFVEVANDSGTNNGSFDVVCDENTGNARSTVITVGGGGGVSKTVNVSQAKKSDLFAVGDVLQVALGTGIFEGDVTQYDAANKNCVIQLRKVQAGRASLMAMGIKAFFGISAINGVVTKPDQFAPPTYFAYENDGKNYPLNLSKGVTGYIFEPNTTDIQILNKRANDLPFENGLFKAVIEGIDVYIGYDEYNIRAVQMHGYTFICQDAESASSPLIFMGFTDYDFALIIRQEGIGSVRILSKIDLNGVSESMLIRDRSSWSNVQSYYVGQQMQTFETILDNMISIGSSRLTVTTTDGTFVYNIAIRQE